uniref:Ovule protein n=1 Tax=Strongyloides venezuelensis TaxID=75913 RepID=A0A0K0FSU4_STRVS
MFNSEKSAESLTLSGSTNPFSTLTLSSFFITGFTGDEASQYDIFLRILLFNISLIFICTQSFVIPGGYGLVGTCLYFGLSMN